MMQDLSVAVISQWRKEAMRSTLKTFKKTIIDADKAAKAKLVQKVGGGCDSHSSSLSSEWQNDSLNLILIFAKVSLHKNHFNVLFLPIDLLYIISYLSPHTYINTHPYRPATKPRS